MLAAYDGSTESAKALKRFIQLSLWPDITLKIVCFDLAADEANPLLTDSAVYCRAHGLEPETELVEGSPRDGLLEHAGQWRADLIVRGSTSRARIFKHLLGDTALHAVRNAEVPLFLTQ